MPATGTTELDESAGATPTHYHYTRVVDIAGHTVRARVERNSYLDQSYATAEIFNDQATWTTLTAEAPSTWWHDTPPIRPGVDARTVLGPLTEQLLGRAVAILACYRQVTTTFSPHVHGAISALLATTHGFDAEVRIDPEDISWARGHGGTLHIVEHPDGGVTFTKAHRDDCPFITTRGAQHCDEVCHFPHLVDHHQDLDG